MNRAFTLILAFSFLITLFVGCEAEFELKENLSETKMRRVFREATYSTYIDDLENIGTINRVYFDEVLTPKEGYVQYKRKFINDGSSKGFLRKTNAVELAYRTDLDAKIVNGALTEIKGFEKYDSEVVDAMSLPTYFVNRLKSAEFKRQQKSDLMTWYGLTHTLKGKLIEKQVLKGDDLKAFNEKGLLIDSILISNIQKVEGVDCLKYSLFYETTDPLNIMVWEQHKVALGDQSLELKNYKFQSAKTKVQHDVFQDPETGLLCREREFKVSENIIVDSESGAQRSFKSNQIIESLYDYNMGKKE